MGLIGDESDDHITTRHMSVCEDCQACHGSLSDVNPSKITAKKDAIDIYVRLQLRTSALYKGC